MVGSKYDVVAAFSFGLPISSAVNRALNERAEVLSRRKKIAVMKETEFVLGLGWDDNKGASKWVSSTLKFSKYLASKGFHNVLVVAALDHAPRCVRDLKKLGLKAEADNCFKDVGKLCYYADSLQLFTRVRWRFLTRQFIINLLPWWIYEKIAG